MIITSLDIGSNSIKAIVAEIKNNGRLLVLAAFKQPSAGFRKGVLVDFEEATVSLRNIISDLKRVTPKSVKNVNMSMLMVPILNLAFPRGSWSGAGR